MPIPTEGYPLTAAMSPRVQVVESTGSTQSDVLDAAATDVTGWPHLSMLLTTDQRHGRGRLDRTWTAPADTAIATSIVLRLPDMPLGERSWIPLVAGAAMARAVRAQLPASAHTVSMKWPNDVLVDGRKISGIIAAVVPDQPTTIVVGVGVNTRMLAVDLPVATATSFGVLGLACDDDLLMSDFLRDLDTQTRGLAAEAGSVHGRVAEECGTLGAHVSVTMPDGTHLHGRADRLGAGGQLVVVHEDGRETQVSAGDVIHVR